jgi:hypothetical protein
MTTLTEAIHTGAYEGSVVDRQLCFETATVKSGQNLKAGQVIELDGDGKIIACSGTLDSDSALATDVVGILHKAVDASATGENGDVTGQVYLARLATVKDDVLTYPEETSEGGEKAAVIASLAKLMIRPR